MPRKRQTFSKSERLCSRKMIEALFTGGKVFFLHPFRVIWIERADDEPVPVKVIFAVSKRNFKKAVERNHIKRMMREAYRINKSTLYESLSDNSIKIAVMIQYTGKEMLSHPHSENKMQSLLDKLDRKASEKEVST